MAEAPENGESTTAAIKLNVPVTVDAPPEVEVHDRIMDAYYGKMGDDFMRKTQERVHWVCAGVRGNRILDVGCSQGIVPILLGREGKHVLGVDTDLDAIAVAEAHLAAGPSHVSNYVSFVHADFMGHDFDGELFDTVIMSEVLEHLVNPQAFIKRAAELLNEAGALVVTLPFGINDFIDHKRTYYLVEAFELISRLFEVQEVELFGKWIGFRCERLVKSVDTITIPAIPRDVLRATEKAFYALERSLTDNLKKTRQQLAVTNERVKETTRKLSDANGARATVEAKAATLESRLSALETQRAAAIEHGKLTESRKVRAEVAQIQQKLQKTNSTLIHYKTRLADEYAQLQFVQTTLAFQLGSILTYAFRSPVDFLKTPLRLIRLTKAALFRDASGRPAAVFVPDLPSAHDIESPPITYSAVKSAMRNSALNSESVNPEWQGMSALGWPDCSSGDRPVVMAVMDEFTTGCFENDVALVLPRPDNWRVLAEKCKPELFFIESAWEGNGGSWQYRVAEYASRPGEEVADMALYASDHNIPLVFWNKEDPVHHQKFMVTAKMADHIFTTDANMLDSYREKTGNRSVYALPFAAQPALHFPAILEGRQNQSCFAGSWYGDRHEKRGESMRWLLRAANRSGLVIYDRNHGSGNFTFPEEYHEAIKGGLPYKELCAEYRRYRVFLNVNSVTESPTMFSRRVFELMACGTPIVSTYAKGIEELFESNAVWLVDSEEQAEEAIRTLLSDDAEWRLRSLAGIRDVFSNHTYAHRLNQIFGQIDLATRLPVDPRVRLLALAANEGEVERLVEVARIQHYPSLSVRIGAPVKEARTMRLGTTEVTIVPEAQLVSPDVGIGAKAMGWLSARAAYGPGYVRDLANAMTYRPEAHGWGKAVDGDAFAFGQPGQLQSSLWRPDQFQADLQPGALVRRLSSEHFFIADQAEYASEGSRLQVLEK